MKIVIFTHPKFLDSQSMPRFANLIFSGMKSKGYEIEYCTADAVLFKLPFPKKFKKWLGYIDQFLIFPIKFKLNLSKLSKNTLFVFADHALGPWVPLVQHLPHIIHCHDFLAQMSAKGQIKENPTGLTGKLYQKYIHWGYCRGKNFISISSKTQTDLHNILKVKPLISIVVYNPISQIFEKKNKKKSREYLFDKLKIEVTNGYILHVGGNQWYKNRKGVIDIYNSWREISEIKVPLFLIGVQPSSELTLLRLNSKFKNDIHFISNIHDEDLSWIYSGARLLLFPSLAEGFGWPIAEAMKCECIVVTTNDIPMTEVAGGAAYLIPKYDLNGKFGWSEKCARVVETVMNLQPKEHLIQLDKGNLNVERFSYDKFITQLEDIYMKVQSKTI